MQIIRWGILGLGKIAHSFAADLIEVEGARLQAVGSRDQEKANAFAKAYSQDDQPMPTAYSSYEELLQDPEIDVVYIATPHALHLSNTLASLDHGKAVLCEKPLGLNQAQIQRMMQRAQQQKCFLMEAMWMQFLPHFRFVQRLIQSGDFGAIRNITADFSFEGNFDPESRLYAKSLGGGALLDVGIYPLYLATALLGPPQKVQAKALLLENGVDGSVSIRTNHAQGATANLSASIIEKGPLTARISCENGLIKIPRPFYKGDRVITILHGKETHHDFGYVLKGYAHEIAHVNAALHAGKLESEALPLQRSLELMELMDQVKEQIGLHYA
ncbi:Gfo/Idh/MocA family protein [Croceiramulus getboli]|nr:Gfo/Idh/MocA family oxidoreductase [Flavobacteriaceae bacterium YJPT1-3]